MGGMSLNPLGEGREFNAGLLKPKGKVLLLLYNHGNGIALLQPLGIEVDSLLCFLKSDGF